MNKIDRLRVHDFQSVASADIALGGFTVIVGPSNSGKSAVVRALKAVIRNVNSPAAVRVGKKNFSVEVRAGDASVSLERGKSQSTYRVASPSGEEVYAKAGRTVPDEVQQVLGLPIPDGPDVTFSSQVDPPFLLADTGTVVAKVLGDLTNVSKLHAAAKEANRRRLEATKLAKIRREDAQSAATRLQEEFRTLPEDSHRVKDARSRLSEVRTQAATVEALKTLLNALQEESTTEKSLQESLDGLPEFVDLSVVEGMLSRQTAIRNLLSEFEDSGAVEKRLVERVDMEALQVTELGQEYQNVLQEAGSCPVCGARTKVLV